MNQKLGHYTGQSHNLQLMKFIAAIMVICSHAFPIVTGSMKGEPIYQLTKGQLSMGGFSVAVFFLSAGYFIAASVEKKKTVRSFFLARCIRIFPLLWIVVILSILLGACVTTNTMSSYWTDRGTWLYLLNGLLFPVHNLPGVFEQAPYLPTVNGALWTLPVEFACYIVCFIIYKMNFLKEKWYFLYLIPASMLAILILFVEEQYPFLMQVYRPCFLFHIGMGFWIYRDKIKLCSILFWPALLLFVVSLVCHAANIGMFILFPYLCMYLCFGEKQVSGKLDFLGNMSYGIYLCGFPIQQLLVEILYDRAGLWLQMLIACVVACLVGVMLMKIDNFLKII